MDTMNNDIKLTLLGGDIRQLSVARRLCEEFAYVSMWGIDGGNGEIGDAVIYREIEDALKDCDVVILPLPASSDGVRISCPLSPELPSVRLQALLDDKLYNGKKPLILGGRLSPAFKEAAKKAGFKAIDYYENELLQIKNALPTAEGALELAMRTLDKTIHSSKSAVIGYGRISKALSRMLLAMKSDVTVAARKPSDLAYAEIDGCKTLKITYEEGKSSLSALCSGYDVIFNTVPYWVFNREVIEAMDKNTLVIDLASAPGGFDINALKDTGIAVIRAASLPGKCAPISAGQIIGDTILEILRAEGVSS